MAYQQIMYLERMTVPELQFELHYKPHTVVDQYIINDMIKRKTYSQFTCQADKKFTKKFRTYSESCIKGVPSQVIIKDNNNVQTFNKSDFKYTLMPCDQKPLPPLRGREDLNTQLNYRFYEDISSNKQIHSNPDQFFEKPYK